MSFGTCVICREVLTDGMVATFCGHVFHRTCLATWLKESQVCPNCRSYCSPNMCIRLYPELTTCSVTCHDGNITCPSGAVVKATQSQVLQLQRQCAALSEHVGSLGAHIEEFKRNIKETSQMLRDIHAVLDDIADPQSVTLPVQEMAEEAEVRQTVFSKADLSDLQTIVHYLESRITFYEELYCDQKDV